MTPGQVQQRDTAEAPYESLSLENISFYRLATPTVTVPWYLECLDSTMNRRNFFQVKQTVTTLLSQALK